MASSAPRNTAPHLAMNGRAYGRTHSSRRIFTGTP
jgi:hypothetical protein